MELDTIVAKRISVVKLRKETTAVKRLGIDAVAKLYKRARAIKPRERVAVVNTATLLILAVAYTCRKAVGVTVAVFKSRSLTERTAIVKRL